MYSSISQWSPPEKITISRYIFHKIAKWLTDGLPEERCGILAADSGGLVRKHFPIENMVHSPTRFQMNPKEQLKAMLWMENKQVPQMIIYHSHPQGPARLSETDLAEAYYPEAIYMLWHSPMDRWKI